MLVVARASDARAHGWRSLGTVKGLASTSNGRGKSVTAPSPEAEARAMRDAYARAGVAPQALGYLEAHATGTLVGDLAEAQAIAAVLPRAASDPVPLGAVKAQIGHLKAASAGASLLKVLLSMENGVLPRSLVDGPSPHLPWDEMGCCVLERPRAWKVGSSPRLAGVSAFGFGGINYHAVIEGPEGTPGA